ncbi:MFS transporter [Actinomadura nitritigenes]|uniref:MFS transporter n=1 Tax=Actinomadura nitritigenes TaxID=134602 RepID=UPI003D8EB285
MGTVDPTDFDRQLRAPVPAPPIAVGRSARPTAGGGGPRRRRWRQLALLSGLISMDSSESNVVTMLFPVLRTALGVPVSALGTLVALAKVTGMVTAPLWVVVAQRFRRKTVLVVCAGLWGLWSVAAGLSQNFTQLVILYTVAAAGYAGGQALVNGMLADLFDDASRGRAAGFLYAGIAFVMSAVSPLLGLLSRVHDGWRYGFFVFGSVTVLFGLLVAVFFRDPGVGAAEPEPRLAGSGATVFDRAALGELLRNRTLMLVLLQRLLSSQFVLLSFGVVFLVDVRHYSNAQASLIVAPAMLAYAVGTGLGGLVVDRVSVRLPTTGRLVVWQAVTLAWAPTAFLATQVAWNSTVVYMVLFVAVSVLQGFVPGSNRPVLMAVVRPELRSAAFSLMYSAESAGWALTTLIAGYVGTAFGLQAALLWVAVVLTFADGLLMTLMYRPYLRQSRALAARSK